MNRIWLAAVALLILIPAAAFHVNPDNFMADDAYFYLQIADNIAQGNGSTFHQITPTNGYHPLWMLCCVAGAYFSKGNHLVLLHLMAFIQLLLYGGSLYFLYRIADMLKVRFFMAGVFVLTFVMVNSGGLRLFESHLAILLQLATLYMFLKLLSGSGSTGLFLPMGTLLGLCFLARLDASFFIGAIAAGSVYIVLKESGCSRAGIGAILLASLPAMIIAAAYLAHNMYHDGHPIPISGLIKTTYPHPYFRLDALGPHGKMAVEASLLLLGLMLWVRRKMADRVMLYAVLFAGVFLHAAYTAVYSWGSQWYYITAYIALAIAAMDMLTWMEESLSGYRGKLALVFAPIVNGSFLALMALAAAATVSKTFYNYSLFMAGFGYQTVEHYYQDNPGRKVAGILKQRLMPGSTLFVFDAPGILAYYSDFKILPADGLVNDAAYDRAIVENGIEAFLQEKGVQYYLGPIPEGSVIAQSATIKSNPTKEGWLIEVTSPLSHQPAGTLILQQRDLLLVLPPPLRPYGKEQPSYGLWKIN